MIDSRCASRGTLTFPSAQQRLVRIRSIFQPPGSFSSGKTKKKGLKISATFYVCGTCLHPRGSTKRPVPCTFCYHSPYLVPPLFKLGSSHANPGQFTSHHATPRHDLKFLNPNFTWTYGTARYESWGSKVMNEAMFSWSRALRS